MVDRNFILQILVKVLHKIIFVDGFCWQPIKHIFEDISCELGLDGVAEGVQMHVVIRLISKVAMPEIDCVFGRQVVCHAENLRRNLCWAGACGSSLPCLLLVGCQE